MTTNAETLNHLVEFIQEVLTAMTQKESNVNLDEYDLSNPASLQEAQESQIRASQYINVLTEKTVNKNASFRVLDEQVSCLFKEFKFTYSSTNPKIRGMDKDVYDRQLEILFNQAENFDLSLMRQISLRFSDLLRNLDSRREFLKQTYFTIKNQFKIYESSLSTHTSGVTNFPTKTTDVSVTPTPMPRVKVPALPPPAGVPELPPEYRSNS